MSTATPPASGTATPTLTAVQIAKSLAAAESPSIAQLDASKLTTTFRSPLLDPNAAAEPGYSLTTDHMITASWHLSTGWSAPRLEPYAPFLIHPTASVLQYATSCFEGMKLYRGHDGKLRLFRPALNCARMLRSATRVALPGFDTAELQKLVVKLCSVEGPRWLPASRKGENIYIRPTLIADAPSLGVQRPGQAKLIIFLADNPTGAPVLDGLKLLASREDSIRAWPGGFGFAKLGANYGPSLVAQGEARERGFAQVLWLFGKESYVTEAGASNFFVVWRTKEGETEMVTAPLTDGVILEGVTRRSILELARSRFPDLKVTERQYSMQEVRDAQHEGRLVEAFAAGTAFFVAPVGLIEWKGETLKIPLELGGSGKYAAQLKEWLGEIMYGGVESEWATIVPEE